MVVALEIKEAAEEMELSGIDMAVNADVWNVKLFRWLDNKEDSAVYRENVKQLAPAIISVLPLEYRGRVVKNDNFALRIARSVKEDAEAIQAVVLKAPQARAFEGDQRKHCGEVLPGRSRLCGAIDGHGYNDAGGNVKTSERRKPRCANTNGFQVQIRKVIASSVCHKYQVNIQPTHKCSFCGKTNVEVAGVLMLGLVPICQDAFLCVEIVFKHSARTDEPTAI
jgi:hypothetical protein